VVSDPETTRTDEERLAIAEAALGHAFTNRALLRRALTHPSFKEGSPRAAQDKKPRESALSGRTNDYERLEFLGDAVISLVVADELYARFPHVREGGLTKLKIGAVSGRSLSAAAEELGLADALFLGESERGTGGRGLTSALENSFEALVAALYLDAGFDAARAFVSRALGAHIGEHTTVPGHPKSDLQEYFQARGSTLSYRLVAEEGPPHDRSFTVTVSVGGEELGTGVGRSKKEAEMRAAAEAIERLGIPTNGAVAEHG